MKRSFWVEEFKALKTFKEFENEDKKWKREKEDFFCFANLFWFNFFWNFELCWFHIFLRSKVTALQNGSILPVFARFWQFLAYFGRLKLLIEERYESLNTFQNPAKFKVSENYKLKYFGLLHFRILWKSFKFFYSK